MEKTETVVHGPGLMGGISGLAKNLFGLVVSRVELAALEMSQVRNHVIELLALFAGAVIDWPFRTRRTLASGSGIGEGA